MMGCIYKRGDVFWIKYRAGGRSHYESSGSTEEEGRPGPVTAS